MLVKVDGGLDLNSQMGLGPTTGFDRRDNRPGYASDVWLGYEQAAQQLRYGPEKFGARDVARDNIVSLGAETYYYTVGTTDTQVVNGSGGGLSIKTQTADWVYHDPAATNTANGRGTATQRVPYNPNAGQAVDIWVKSGYQFQIDKCFIYYTTDGTNPEGAFGVGKGTTQVVEAGWQTNDVAVPTIDWWKGTIPAASASTQVRYKVALFKGGYSPIDTISDADNAKLYGLTQFGITNFNPTTAQRLAPRRPQHQQYRHRPAQRIPHRARALLSCRAAASPASITPSCRPSTTPASCRAASSPTRPPTATPSPPAPTRWSSARTARQPKSLLHHRQQRPDLRRGIPGLARWDPEPAIPRLSAGVPVHLQPRRQQRHRHDQRLSQRRGIRESIPTASPR